MGGLRSFTCGRGTDILDLMETSTYIHLPVGHTPPSLEGCRPFKAILVIEQATDDGWRSGVCEWLVRVGCRYLLAWGLDCETWHDKVDEANLAAFNFQEIPDDDFIMTTWHADEPLREVMWFAVHAACHPTISLDHTIIVHISDEERGVELLKTFRQAQSDPV